MGLNERKKERKKEWKNERKKERRMIGIEMNLKKQSACEITNYSEYTERCIPTLLVLPISHLTLQKIGKKEKIKNLESSKNWELKN